VVTGGIDFSNLFVNLGEGTYTSLAAARDAGAPVFAYGAFITAVINFLIIAWVVFLLVKAVNRIRDAAMKAEPPAAPAPKGPSEVDLLIEIRDALKARG
jgi:large conductance mechanosensitive channel